MRKIFVTLVLVVTLFVQFSPAMSSTHASIVTPVLQEGPTGGNCWPLACAIAPQPQSQDSLANQR